MGTMMDFLKHEGTTDRERDRLKMSVKTPVQCFFVRSRPSLTLCVPDMDYPYVDYKKTFTFIFIFLRVLSTQNRESWVWLFIGLFLIFYPGAGYSAI